MIVISQMLKLILLAQPEIEMEMFYRVHFRGIDRICLRLIEEEQKNKKEPIVLLQVILLFQLHQVTVHIRKGLEWNNNFNNWVYKLQGKANNITWTKIQVIKVVNKSTLKLSVIGKVLIWNKMWEISALIWEELEPLIQTVNFMEMQVDLPRFMLDLDQLVLVRDLIMLVDHLLKDN